MMKSGMIALLLLTAATGVSAAEKDKEEQGATEKSDKDKVVCKTEKNTGSLTRKKRTCRTRAQWDEVAAAARKGTEDWVRDNSRLGNQPGDGFGSAAGGT